MQPAVKVVLDAAEAGRSPAQGAEDLGALLAKLLQACQGACRQLLDSTLAAQAGLTGFGLLGNSILAEVDSALAERLPGKTIEPARELVGSCWTSRWLSNHACTLRPAGQLAG